MLEELAHPWVLEAPRLAVGLAFCHKLRYPRRTLDIEWYLIKSNGRPIDFSRFERRIVDLNNLPVLEVTMRVAWRRANKLIAKEKVRSSKLLCNRGCTAAMKPRYDQTRIH